MVKALTFKGDKPSKKRKRPATTVSDDPTSSSTALTSTSKAPNPPPEDVPEDDTWVTADLPTDIAGPIILVLPSTLPTCLACDANGKVFASPLENIVEGDPATAEPHDVRQVWVATRVAGGEGVISFKGHHGRYLSTDKSGTVSAHPEAISPSESFHCIPVPGTPSTMSIQTLRDTFLSVSSTSPPGSPSHPSNSITSASIPTISALAESIAFHTTFRIRMQARFKPRLKASKEEKARGKISRRELEDVVGRRLDEAEVARLKRARREGNFHEEILDVRVKGKHDKFAS
ncbi:MAG: hypothetical protein M1817_000271 [Caeruleum heppii]|nr:MAG: hypothetical protein M1817_000271 [Caeruleum heppii]